MALISRRLNGSEMSRIIQMRFELELLMVKETSINMLTELDKLSFFRKIRKVIQYLNSMFLNLIQS